MTRNLYIAWQSPPIGVTVPYAAQLATVRQGGAGALVLRLKHGTLETVELALLEYPVACVSIAPLAEAFDEVAAMCAGEALAELAAAFEKCGWPFNVVACGGQVFVFVRSADAERSPQLPMLKLGSSEMMGCFHCQSEEELQVAAEPGVMAAALASTSAPHLEVWTEVGRILEHLNH